MCTPDCTETYSVHTPALNGGLPCTHADGQILTCSAGQGQCPDSLMVLRVAAVLAIVVVIAGFFGGISGQWGPPLVIFFLSQNLKVGQFIGFQGIVYSIGSVSLLFGHLQSGVLTKDLTLLSLPLVFICCLGQLIGYMVRTFQHIDGIKKFSLICLFAFGILLIIRAVLSGFQILNL